jgi:hypothetical protein
MQAGLQLSKIILVCGVALALALHIPALAAPADACKNILTQFKAAADRANREIESTASNLREAASQVANDKRRISLIARSCAASAEALGILKSYRIVVAECMGDDPKQKRSDILNELDRAISKIRVVLDKACD